MPKPVEKTTKKNGGVTGKGFKPGKSGNPKGRPKGSTSINDILRRIGAETIETTAGKMTKQEAVYRKVFEAALQGKPWATQFIAERQEGKAVDRVQLTEVDRDEVVVLGAPPRDE